MRRAFAATIVAAAAWAAWAQPAAALDGCGPRDVRQLAAGVPAVSGDMVPAGPAATAREATFANPDDARIAVTAMYVPQPAAAPGTRQAYVAEVQRHLDAIPSRPGVSVAAAVDPSDPVSWSVTRQVSGDAPATTGEDVVLVSPTCRLVVDWQAPDVPVLQGRVSSLRRGLAALHAAAAAKAEPVAYVDEDYTPSGGVALAMGLALPLAVAAILSFLALRVSEGRAPRSRALPAATAALAAGGLALLLPAALGDMAAGGRYLDGAALLGAVAAAGALAAARPAALATAASASTAVAAGVSLGVSAWFGWLPSQAGMVAASSALFACGVAQAWSWLRPATDAKPTRRASDDPARARA